MAVDRRRGQYNPAWAGRFDAARSALVEAITSSTSNTSGRRAGPSAKPVIDIDLTVADSADETSYVPALLRLGYRLVLREPWWHGHRMLVSAEEDVHLHIWPPGAPEPVRHRLFRDRLRTHPEDLQLYAEAEAPPRPRHRGAARATTAWPRTTSSTTSSRRSSPPAPAGGKRNCAPGRCPDYSRCRDRHCWSPMSASTPVHRRRRRRDPAAGRAARRSRRRAAVGAAQHDQRGPADGDRQGHPQPARAQPGRRHRLHGLRLARPEPAHRHTAEFCENGAKAVARRRPSDASTPDFFAEHPLADLAGRTDYWLGQQGRLTQPMVLPRRRHPLRADLVGRRVRARSPTHLRGARRPGRGGLLHVGADLATRRRSSTSCSPGRTAPTTCPTARTCATSRRRSALAETIGIGKGSVSLQDIHEAELIVIAGQNPGTNHPRMLTALEKAKRNGARIVAVNPLPEAGLMRFDNPQKAARAGRPRHRARRRPARSGSTATSRCSRRSARSCSRETRRRRSTATSSTGTPTASRNGARTSRDVDWDAVLAATGLARPRSSEPRRRCSRVASASSSAGRWASPSTTTRSPRSRRSSTSPCCRATSASPVPGCARCAATPTCRATAPWASGRSRRPPSSTRCSAEFGFDAAARARARRRRRRPGDARRRGEGVHRRSAATSPPRRPTPTSPRGDARRRAHRAGLHQAQPHPRRRRPHALILPTLGRTEQD